MLIPIGHDQQTVRRLPWVTIAIIALNFLCFLGVGGSVRDAEKAAKERLQRTIEYWQEHPYLDLPDSFVEVVVPPGERNQFRLMAEAMKGAGVDVDPEQRREEQDALEALARDVVTARDEHPYFSWGLVPAKPSASAFLSSMFMHAGWLHLLSNMFILFLVGPAIEDAYGRPWYAAFYLVSGVAASLVQIASFPQSDSPLVGASGALAGVMGAFLIRCWRTKIRFFYWYFLRGGTFDAPAWFMLPLWLLQQVFYGMLTKSADGVAYWAHVGGFVFGAVVALAMRRLRVEERFIRPKIESKITLEQHPGLREGVDLLARGEIEAARESLARAIADEPGNPDAHLAMWQSYAQVGEARRGAGEMVKVIEVELKAGELDLALDHWRELVENARLGGPASLRWRLASQLAEAGRTDADEVFRHLAADPTAELLGDKARRRLGLPEPPPTAAPTETSLPGPAMHPPAAPTTMHAEAATGFASGAVPAEEEPPTEPEPRQITTVEGCILEKLEEAGAVVRGEGGEAEVLLYTLIDAVSVAGIGGDGKPYLVVDLVVGFTSQHRRIFRLLSTQMDPRRILQWFDAAPLDAFRELVRRLADASGGTLLPGPEALKTFKMFPTIAAYEAEVFGLDR